METEERGCEHQLHQQCSWEIRASRTKEKAILNGSSLYLPWEKDCIESGPDLKNKSHPNKSEITGFRILRNYIRFRFLGSWRGGSTVKSIVPLKRTRVQVPIPRGVALTACYSSSRGPRAKQVPALTFTCPPPTHKIKPSWLPFALLKINLLLYFLKVLSCLVPCGVNMLALTTLKDARHLKLTLDAFALSK